MPGPQDGYDLLMAELDGKPDDTMILARVDKQPEVPFYRDFREFYFQKARLKPQPTQVIPVAAFAAVAGLRIRKGPGTSFEIVDVLSLGEQVTIVKVRKGWAEVSSPTAGWVSTEYLADEVPKATPR